MKTFYLKILFATAVGTCAGIISRNPGIGAAVTATLLVVSWAPIYIKYAHNNPKHYWFKRKLFGWGWTPVTWQGWLCTALYIAGIWFFASTLDENAPTREVALMFILPAAILTTLLIRIAYRKGESPRWQWGKGIKEYP